MNSTRGRCSIEVIYIGINRKEKKEKIVTMKQEEESKLDNIKKVGKTRWSIYNSSKFWKHSMSIEKVVIVLLHLNIVYFVE